MEFRILGPLEVISDGRSLELGGAKQRCLLAVLLLAANKVVPSDRLIDALWEDDPPESAQKALQVHVSGLRKVLGKDRLATRGSGYQLRVDERELDLAQFESLRDRGSPADALSLWRGQPLSDFGSRRFAQAEIARLEDVRLACLEQRIDQDLGDGRHNELTGELEGLVQEHPLREHLRAQLMLALYRSGRQADALAVYQEGRHALVDELGIEPGRELRELQQTILRQDPALELGREPDRGPSVSPASGFVGRERELAELTSGLDDAFAGRGRLFLLQGEPGIGKSRLADEVTSRARIRGAHVLVGRCWEAGGAPAYWPWTQSLRGYVRVSDPDAARRQLGSGAAEVAQIVPELHDLIPGLRPPEPVEPEADRFRLFDATASFLRNVGGDRPTVVALDDLHAADEPSLLLLRYVASTLAESRILIVGTFRDLDPTVQDPLASTLAELSREPVTRRIQLGGLSEPEVGRLAELTAATVPSTKLVADLYAETEGNPLFVSEIVRLLAAEGRFESAESGRMPIPETIREAIGRRLRTLTGECRRVLSLGSVFGREFGLVALERVADYTGIDKLLSVLDEAIRARVLEQVPGSLGRLRFAHALTRESLYEEIPATHRTRLHRRVAEVLEALYAGNPGPHLAELAHHFSLAVPAAPPEKAIDFARRAGDEALAAFAFEEAARLYELALGIFDAMSAGDGARRLELLFALGDARARAGNALLAKETFYDAANLARSLGLSRELAQAAGGYGGRIVWGRAGRDDRLVPLLEEGLAGLGEDDVELRVMLLSRLAGALRDEHSRARRDALSAEAVEIARRSRNDAALAYALDGRLYAIIAPDTVDEFLGLGTELCEVAGRLGDEERLVQGHMHQFIAHITKGQIADAERELELTSEAAERLRQPAQLWQVEGVNVLLAVHAGRISEARERIPRMLELGRDSVPDSAVPHWVMQCYTLSEFQGGLEEHESSIRSLVDDYPARVMFRCVLVHLCVALGRVDEARGLLAKLGEDEFEAVPFDQEWLFGMALLAEAASDLGELESCQTLYRLLAPWGHLNAVDAGEGGRGSLSRHLGRLAAAVGRWDDATGHFEYAVEMNQRMGARPWLAFAQEEYAGMLRTRGETGDHDRARALIEEALAAYRELGMEPHAARAATAV